VSNVAATDSTVLISGETGTGKELIARATHQRSRRSSKNLLKNDYAWSKGHFGSGLLRTEIAYHWPI
jgi:formate hydrogenlyase transcriptional activator